MKDNSLFILMIYLTKNAWVMSNLLLLKLQYKTQIKHSALIFTNIKISPKIGQM